MSYVGNLAPMPGVFPDYPAPVVRNAGAEREMWLMRWGMPPPPKFGGAPLTNIRNTSSEGLRYTILDEWLPKILAWIKSDASARYEGAMGAEGLFQVESIR